MSTYITIPNSIITSLTKKSKHHEAYTYALIKNQIKDSSKKACITEAELATLLGKDERTINTYISTLKASGLILQQERKKGDGAYPYNVYQFAELTDDYFIVLPPFLVDNNISPKLKGLLLFIKANCWKGTNYLRFNGRTTDLPAKLGVGKNQLSDYLEELESKGYIRFIGNTLHVINENFPLYRKPDMWNVTYQIIYDYCLEHNTIPPIKKIGRNCKDKALSYIVGAYTDDYDRLRNVLKERCKNLPENLTLEYFCQALVNKKPTKDDRSYAPIFL